MADVTASDLSRGPQVKWYAGGVPTTETHTVSSAEVSAGGFALTKAADYGMLVVVKSNVQIAYTGYQSNGTDAATETSGIEFIKYTGITEADVITLYYIDGETTGLTHITSAQDFKTSSKADTEKIAVHGQANKINVVGVTEHSGSFSQLQVTSALKALFVGARTEGPATGEYIWSNKVTGFKSDLCLVGKKIDSLGNVTHKWGLIDVSFSGHDQEFPVEGTYTDSFTIDIGFLIEWDNENSGS